MGDAPDAADYPFTFRCRRSGNCCAIPGGVVRVTADERTAIARWVGLAEAAFASRYVQPDGVTLKEGLGNRCVFLADGADAACSIYPVRPARCRSWPYWPEVLQDRALLDAVVRTCPGIEVRSPER